MSELAQDSQIGIARMQRDHLGDPGARAVRRAEIRRQSGALDNLDEGGLGGRDALDGLFPEPGQKPCRHLGDDVARHSGNVYIRGVPLVWVPAWTNTSSINAKTDGPVVGVNWETFKWYYQAGRNMRKRKPFQHPDMSNVRVRCMDDSGQVICFNRRANFIGYSSQPITETA